MSDQETQVGIPPIARHLLPNSASEHHLALDHSLSSRCGESLPSMNDKNEQITQIGTNLSRFPDDFTNLNDSNLETTSPITPLTESAEQLSTDIEKLATVDTQSEEPKSLGRWDDAWEQHEKQLLQGEEQEENHVIPPPKEEKPLNTTPVHPTHPPSINITRIYVREFLPTSADDPIFSTLRDLFVRSFDEFYQEIETQLSLKSETSLLQWLDETFDEEEQEILAKRYRCFLLCGNENDDVKEIILGFLTLREEDEEGTIYIAQVAIHLKFKRRGYGAQLLQHLRNIYPPNTQYWGLCRRANWPALQFYLKQGARFMESDEIATKYDYDPSFYAAFEFVDTIPVIGSENPPLGRLKPNVEHPDDQLTTIIETVTNGENLPATGDVTQVIDLSNAKPKKVVGCCALL